MKFGRRFVIKHLGSNLGRSSVNSIVSKRLFLETATVEAVGTVNLKCFRNPDKESTHVYRLEILSIFRKIPSASQLKATTMLQHGTIAEK